MHEWHICRNTNLNSLINEFIGFEYRTDWTDAVQTIKRVTISDRSFNDTKSAEIYVCNSSYGDDGAVIAMLVGNKKATKGFQKALENYKTKRKDYLSLERDLNLGYGRKSEKVTCPQCNSSISLKYGSRFKACPVCGSKKIISDSNWKSLETKKKLMIKASEALAEEAVKNSISFVGGFEWHS